MPVLPVDSVGHLEAEFRSFNMLRPARGEWSDLCSASSTVALGPGDRGHRVERQAVDIGSWKNASL
jgi:hypothetical protein